MRIGYARVSTDEQNLDLQILALKADGCDSIITDQGFSGARLERPGLCRVLNECRAGDTLVVWRLDRLGRSLSQLLVVMNDLRSRGIDFASLNEAIDTGTPAGMFMFHMVAALAEFERALISDRTKAGLEAAKSRGARLGRPPALDAEQISEAKRLLESESIADVASRFGLQPKSLRRILDRSP